MNTYDIAIIFHPSLSDEEAKKYAETLEKKIKDPLKGKVLSKEDWGRRNLTYKISHQNMGYYYFIQAEIDSVQIKKLETDMNLDKKILRHLINKLA